MPEMGALNPLQTAICYIVTFRNGFSFRMGWKKISGTQNNKVWKRRRRRRWTV